MSRALIVEADRGLIQALDTALKSEGLEVVAAENAQDALKVVNNNHPDVTILDPVLFWFGSPREHESSHHSSSDLDTAVVILIPKITFVERGISENPVEAGSVIKLVDTNAVIARIKSIQRREPGTGYSVVLRADMLEMDLDRWSVSVEGRLIELTVKEFELLRMLLKAKGRVLTRNVLHQIVWDHDEAYGVGSRTVDVHIGRLRKKLGLAGRYIMTVRGVGYRLSVLAEQVSRNDDKKNY